MDKSIATIDFKTLHFTSHSIKRGSERLNLPRSKVAEHIKKLLRTAKFSKPGDDDSLIFNHIKSGFSVVLSSDLKRVVTIFKMNAKPKVVVPTVRESRILEKGQEIKVSSVKGVVQNPHFVEAIMEKRKAVELELTERMFMLKAKIGRTQAMMFDAKIEQLHTTREDQLTYLVAIEVDCFNTVKAIRVELHALEQELKVLNNEAERLVG